MAQMENTRQSRAETLERFWSRSLAAIREQGVIENAPALWNWTRSRGRPSERRTPQQRREALELALVLAVTPAPQPMIARWADIARNTARLRIDLVNAARTESADFRAAFDRSVSQIRNATYVPVISNETIERFSQRPHLSPGGEAESADPAAEAAAPEQAGEQPGAADDAGGAAGAPAEAAGEAS